MESGENLARVLAALGDTRFDVAPIVIVLVGFQALVLRRRLLHMRRTIIGIAYVVLGLALFLVGLEQALFPLGKTMAQQLSSFAFVHGHAPDGSSSVNWGDYAWLYLFAAAIGFATTVAEPSLMAVALKAREVSGGAVNPWGLRLAVATGVAMGVALGCVRIVTGLSLPLFIMAGYGVVIVMAVLSPRFIVPLAFDSGGVTTSTVTVPLVAALGLGLASTIEGRSPLLDGFGLIAFASLFPMITVMGYAQFSAWRYRRSELKPDDGAAPEED
jgi:hypothetical protein